VIVNVFLIQVQMRLEPIRINNDDDVEHCRNSSHCISTSLFTSLMYLCVCLFMCSSLSFSLF